jgi:hypothetical protein
MAKRKNKLLLSDLFPELAAEREVAEEEEREREREEPARKVQRTRVRMEEIGLGPFQDGSRRSGTPVWRCARNGSGRRGGFRRGTRRTRRRQFVQVAEEVQAWWKNWTQARWEKLNEAFGEGWEKECFPYLETGTWVASRATRSGARRTRGTRPSGTRSWRP